MLVVKKFGGSSVANKERIYNVANRCIEDYKAGNDVVVVPGDFGWNDVGSWDVLGSIFPTDEKGNIRRGETIAIDTQNSVVYSDEKLVTAVGIKDLIVVSTEDAVMVCPKDRAQDVKNIVEELKEQKKDSYL